MLGAPPQDKGTRADLRSFRGTGETDVMILRYDATHGNCKTWSRSPTTILPLDLKGFGIVAVAIRKCVSLRSAAAAERQHGRDVVATCSLSGIKLHLSNAVCARSGLVFPMLRKSDT